MKFKWFSYLKSSLTREKPRDVISETSQRTKVDRIDIKKRIRSVLPYMRRQWRYGAVWLAFLILGFLVIYPKPLIYRHLIDNVLLGRKLELLFIVVAVYASVVILDKLCNVANNFYGSLFQQHVQLEIQTSLFNRVLRFPKSFFDDKATGYIMSRLTEDVGTMGYFFTGYLGYMLIQVISSVAGMATLFYLNWKVAAVCLIILPLFFLCSQFFMNRSRILGHQMMEKGAKVSSRLQESLSAFTLIKSFATEKEETEKLKKDIIGSMDASIEMSVFKSFAGISITALGNLASLIVLSFGGYLVICGEWSLGSLLAFQSYLSYVLSPAQNISYSIIQLQSSIAALERVSDLFTLIPEEDAGKGTVVEHLNGRVEFQHITFSYDDGEPVLRDVSHIVEPGSHVAIVGPSGVGKTTLLMLLLRFYHPTRGTILLDGKPIETYEVISLRERIGYVSQNTYLLSGTLMENIRYGNPKATDEEVKEAARIAGIGEFIESLPKGYHQKINELGNKLSEGQKQRISIARALLKKPDILILDEPTSSLDSISEKSIFDVLPDALRDKTLFIVAHRLATAKVAHTIMVLKEGRLVDAGTHDELLARCPIYGKMVENQQL